MPEHTPGRLHVHDELIHVQHEVDGQLVNHSVIAQTFCHRPRYREDAVRLALCWNSHEALVEACQAWMDFSRETKAENPCPDYALRARLREQAKQLTIAALALAQQEKTGG